MATIKHEENIVRIPVKVVSYQQDEKTASMIVKEKYGFSEKRISFDRHVHNVDLQALLKRSRYLKRIKSKVEVEKLYGYLIGVVIDDKLICRSVPETYPQELKDSITKLDKKYQELDNALSNFIKSFPADFDVQTECYKIQNMWLRIWARALVANNKLSPSHLALQLKFLEAVDMAYTEDKYGAGWYSSCFGLTYYLLNSDEERLDMFCEFAKPGSKYKQRFKLCGIEPDNRLLLDYLDCIAREIHRTLAQDIDNLEGNRSHNSAFLSVWEANSDEDEYRFQYRNLSLWRTTNFLFPSAVSEAEMGRFLTETAKF